MLVKTGHLKPTQAGKEMVDRLVKSSSNYHGSHQRYPKMQNKGMGT